MENVCINGGVDRTESPLLQLTSKIFYTKCNIFFHSVDSHYNSVTSIFKFIIIVDELPFHVSEV